VKQLNEGFHKKYLSLARVQSSKILNEADKDAERIRLSAEQSLSHRLRTLSFSLISELRNEFYEKVFQLLAGELPHHTWTAVRVNPEDGNIARKIFRGVEIIPDSEISGGLVITSDDGRIEVDNTFEKRLERAWTIILPEIMKDVYKCHENSKDPR
jgi:vacuolar-type H+-ATPase subunit E/Vma4